MYKAGFIGCGNMGFAIAKAASKVINGENIILSAKELSEAKEKASLLASAFGERAEVVEKSEFIFLAVKPQNLDEVAEEFKGILSKRKDSPVIVSMLAGVSLETLSGKISKDAKFIRIMPNTPVMVEEGVILMCANENVSEEEKEEFKKIMAKSGMIDEIAEKLIDAGTAVSGCGPAFCYMFLDALADGGVDLGIPKDKALLYAAKTLLGSAKMVLETNESPSVLKDRVTSPGGSTIEGVRALEEGAFRGTAINAVVKAYEKTKKLGK